MVEDGKNGWLLPCEDIDAWTGKMIEIAKARDLRCQMGEVSREIANRYDARVTAQRMRDALFAIGPDLK